MNGAGQAAAAGATAGSVVTLSIVAFVIWVVFIVAFWKVFTKMGEPGWKCLIPFYSTYIVYKRTWSVKVFWAFLACCAVTLVFGLMALTISPSGALLAVDPTFSMISYIGQTAAFIIEAISMYYLSKAFGHGFGYFVGLLFLAPIFVLILGLGSSEYVGPKGERALAY